MQVPFGEFILVSLLNHCQPTNISQKYQDCRIRKYYVAFSFKKIKAKELNYKYNKTLCSKNKSLDNEEEIRRRI